MGEKKNNFFHSQRLTLGYTPDTQINLRFVTYNFPAQYNIAVQSTITIMIAISIALQYNIISGRETFYILLDTSGREFFLILLDIVQQREFLKIFC